MFIFQNWKWPAQGTGTVPIVSAHYRSLYEQRLLLVADDGPVRRARQVSESNAARIIGLVMLAASFLPFGVMIGADALQFARWLYQRQPSTVKRHQTAPL